MSTSRTRVRHLRNYLDGIKENPWDTSYTYGRCRTIKTNRFPGPLLKLLWLMMLNITEGGNDNLLSRFILKSDARASWRGTCEYLLTGDDCDLPGIFFRIPERLINRRREESSLLGRDHVNVAESFFRNGWLSLDYWHLRMILASYMDASVHCGRVLIMRPKKQSLPCQRTARILNCHGECLGNARAAHAASARWQ